MRTSTWVKRLFGRSLLARLFFGALLLCQLVVTRWAWLDCDGGTPSLVEYGYFATDEGYYCGGGRAKLLRDRFVSAVRAVPCTFAICPSTHVLTLWAFKLFGQTTWAHRFFPLLFCTGAWLSVFYYLSRRTLPWAAFLLCTACVTNPLLIVYGRTACSDTLMGSLVLFGYIVARKRGRLAPFAGGLIYGLGLWVKTSVWVLFAIGLSASAMASSGRLRLKRMAFFLAGFAVSTCLQYGLIRLIILPDAITQEMDVEELLDIADSSYSLPNVLDWQLLAKGISSFPRCPTDGLLSVWIALFLILPALLLVRRLAERPFRWDGRLLLYAALPLYAGGIMIMQVYYAHYFIPLAMCVPILWFEARRDLKRWPSSKPWFAAALAATGVLSVVLIYLSFTVPPGEADGLYDYLSNAYNLPPKIVWTRNGVRLLSAAALLALLALAARFRKVSIPVFAGVFLCSLGISSLCFSTIPLCEAYKYSTLFSATIKTVALLLQVCAVVFFFAVWCLPSAFRRGVRWYLFLAVLFAAATLANPVWRFGAAELTRRSHLHKDIVAELDRLVPDDAVVFGERAAQLFLSLKPRVSSVPNNDPVPTVLNVHKKHPESPLFAILDTEHNYHYNHYMQNQDKIRMELVHTFKLPSFNNSLPVNVYLVRLHVLKPAPLHGPRIK